MRPRRRSPSVSSVSSSPWPTPKCAMGPATAPPEIAQRIVGELVALAEAEVRDGTGDAAAEVAAALLLRAGEARTAEIARAYEEAVRRLTTPSTLTLMVQAARVRSRADVVLYVL